MGYVLVQPLIVRGTKDIEVLSREAHLVGEEFADRAAGGPQCITA